MHLLSRHIFPEILLALLLPVAISLHAQVQDDFSDGNLNENPTWLGDANDFQVNAAFELQLNAPAAGISILYIPVTEADSAVWEFYFRLGFNPSNANNLRIYLQSDNETLTAGNGYFLSAGEDGSADAIRFFRQDAGTATLLASATAGAVAISPGVRVKVIRENGGLWTLFADYAGGQNFTQELTTTDATYAGGNQYFGFHCTYTATRKDKFFFDDVSVLPLLPDTEPPVLLSAAPVSPAEVDVFFDEPLDELSAGEPANYFLNHGIGEPMAAFPDDTDPTLVHLSLAASLQNLVDYTLTVANVRDVSGNAAPSQDASFTYVEVEEAVAFDVLINEIMADPVPPVALPQVEFVELYNCSGKVLDLEGFGFSSGGTPQLFPAHLLLPGEYVLVSDDSNVDSLSSFGEVVPLANFPALTNDGDELTLFGPSGNVIHHVSYSLGTYKDAQKTGGGWTLELINPLAPCSGEENWRACTNLLGGTPGQSNSALDAVPDEQGPGLVRVFVSPDYPGELQLFFSEALDKTNAENPGGYTISNDIEITASMLLPPGNDAVLLQLSTLIQPGVLYEVSVSNEVTDCIGNPASSNPVTFALPEPVVAQDIVINEILFNPQTGGSDFLELYNRSNKVLNIGSLIIGNIREGIDTAVAQIGKDRLLLPGEYTVITEDPGDIQLRYTVLRPDALLANDLPPFNNDAGNVTLYRPDVAGTIIIDAFDYSEDFHHPLLDDPKGVSLERISPEAPTQGWSNWHSAAEAAGFATPTYRNSQFTGSPAASSGFMDIPEPKLSPDGDGYQDFLVINYKTDRPGYTVKVSIFDSQGRLVKKLVNEELLATEGFFRWDGDTDDGTKARLGIYVVWARFFNPDGVVRAFKKTCVVAGKL
ncbi:MAG: lamin tail domain-containing protein [Saprospiraceae bacterium]